MRISQALNAIEKTRPGILTSSEKLRILSDIDKRIFLEVYLPHENSPVDKFDGYDISTSGKRDLLAIDYFANSIYLRALESECDLKCADTEMYEDSRLLFNAAWDCFARYWAATHKPKGQKDWRL